MNRSGHYNPALHRVALLTAAATFPLIFMGGLVTSHGAGMSVPDWPNSFGYNMFLLPPSRWLSTEAGGVFYEHSHRLMGSVVGMLSIVLALWAWRVERRRWVRWLAAGVLGAVIVQGVLGGLRVVLVNLDLAVVHGCVAQAFFCLATLMAVVTSRWWFDAREQVRGKTADALRSLCKAAVVVVAAVYLQLVVGALMRHYDAGLAIPDLPLAYGKLLPPTDAAELRKVNWDRTMSQGLRAVSLGQVWLHFAHRVGAIVVSTLIVGLLVKVYRRHRGERALTVPAAVLGALLLAQLTLGVCTVLYRKPADVASAHVAVGALVLMTSFLVAARAFRLTWLSSRPSGEVRAARVAKAEEHKEISGALLPA